MGLIKVAFFLKPVDQMGFFLLVIYHNYREKCDDDFIFNGCFN